MVVPKSFILVILEYPMDQAKTADRFRSGFLSSLKINKTEPGGAANRSQSVGQETNRVSPAATSGG